MSAPADPSAAATPSAAAAPSALAALAGAAGQPKRVWNYEQGEKIAVCLAHFSACEAHQQSSEAFRFSEAHRLYGAAAKQVEADGKWVGKHSVDESIRERITKCPGSGEKIVSKAKDVIKTVSNVVLPAVNPMLLAFKASGYVPSGRAWKGDYELEVLARYWDVKETEKKNVQQGYVAQPLPDHWPGDDAWAVWCYFGPFGDSQNGQKKLFMPRGDDDDVEANLDGLAGATEMPNKPMNRREQKAAQNALVDDAVHARTEKIVTHRMAVEAQMDMNAIACAELQASAWSTQATGLANLLSAVNGDGDLTQLLKERITGHLASQPKPAVFTPRNRDELDTVARTSTSKRRRKTLTGGEDANSTEKGANAHAHAQGSNAQGANVQGAVPTTRSVELTQLSQLIRNNFNDEVFLSGVLLEDVLSEVNSQRVGSESEVTMGDVREAINVLQDEDFLLPVVHGRVYVKTI